MELKTKRAYEKPGDSDGYRVLVDRMWPRGMSRDKAGIDVWLKDIAPSDGLRKWFGHDPGKWEEFKKAYFRELDEKTGAVDALKKYLSENETVTLVYAAKNAEHNNARALKEYIGAAALYSSSQ